MNRIIVMLLAILICIPLMAEARLGGSGAQFLVFGGGCRSVAIGGAYVALAEGVDAVYYNPAGLATLDAPTFSFNHGELFADMNLENVAFATPALGGAVGISGVAFLSGDMLRTTFDDQGGRSGETFSANDFSLGLSYARMMTDKFTAGVTFKFINQNIEKVTASGWAFDLGGTYSVGMGDLKLGFAIRNFGPDMNYSGEELKFNSGLEDYTGVEEDIPATYESEDYPLPLIFQLGITYDLISEGTNRLTAVLDGLHPNDQDETFVAGLEYGFNDSYFARVGFNGRQNMGLTAGLGARAALTPGIMASVDYSYEDHEYLDAIQRFSLSISY
jgi:long-subunit fatty acid transport protein